MEFERLMSVYISQVRFSDREGAIASSSGVDDTL